MTKNTKQKQGETVKIDLSEALDIMLADTMPAIIEAMKIDYPKDIVNKHRSNKPKPRRRKQLASDLVYWLRFSNKNMTQNIFLNKFNMIALKYPKLIKQKEKGSMQTLLSKIDNGKYTPTRDKKDLQKELPQVFSIFAHAK
ncbi:hypothetical protein LJC18_04635 [Lachnospiraceae bacterium OttesenSCG-928-E19]|nr:hypothetical protein [Lachnospiraceae bacterium OttesenSCG-928-E19]